MTSEALQQLKSQLMCEASKTLDTFFSEIVNVEKMLPANLNEEDHDKMILSIVSDAFNTTLEGYKKAVEELKKKKEVTK